MTVASTLNRKTFTGDGATTSFGTSPVVFFMSSDLDVYVVTTTTEAATLLTENTHYSVSGGGTPAATGTVDLSGGSSPYGAPSALQTLLIVRNVSLTQETDFVQNDPSDADVAEAALDKITMMAQQLNTTLGRSFVLSDSDVSGASTVIPVPAANALIGWDSLGTSLQNYDASSLGATVVSSFMATVLDDSTAANARTTLDAQQKVESLTADSNPDEGADYVLSYDTSATAAKKVLMSDIVTRELSGRLTLTTAVPVLVADVTTATTIYWTPYRGEILRIYDGTRMVPYASAELSMALDSASGHTGYHQNGKNFDVFAINDAGTLRIGTGPAWSTSTTRGTGAGTTQLEMKNCMLTNKVTATIRFGSASGNTVSVTANKATYLGSFSASADGQTEVKFGGTGAGGSAASILLWNNYNRIGVGGIIRDSTDSWSYNSATIRAADGSTGNRATFMRGLDEDVVTAHVDQPFLADASGNIPSASIGVTSTTTVSGSFVFGASVVSRPGGLCGRWAGRPGLGLQYVSAVEWVAAAVALTFYGDNGASSDRQQGLTYTAIF